MRLPLRLLCIILGCLMSGLLAGTSHAALDKALGLELETVYAKYRTALTQQDSLGWLKQTSRYRQMWLRNQIVSQQLPWPRAVFNLALKPPPFGGLKMVDATSVGDTARLTYYGKIDFGIPGEAAPDNALILWFLKEGSEWKYNTIQYANFNNDPDLKMKVAGGDVTFLQSQDFQISGKYPELPKACEEPYQVARLAVASVGYKTTVSINDSNEETFDQIAGAPYIMGGLRKGPNKISINAKPASGMDPARAQVSVEVVIPTGNPAKPEKALFSWKLDPAKPELPYETNIWAPSKVVR